MSSEPRSYLDPWVGKTPWRRGTATHSSVPAQRIPRRGAWRATVYRSQSRTRLSNYTIAFTQVTLLLKYLLAGTMLGNAERGGLNVS